MFRGTAMPLMAECRLEMTGAMLADELTDTPSDHVNIIRRQIELLGNLLGRHPLRPAADID